MQPPGPLITTHRRDALAHERLPVDASRAGRFGMSRGKTGDAVGTADARVVTRVRRLGWWVLRAGQYSIGTVGEDVGAHAAASSATSSSDLGEIVRSVCVS
jgi:hypothetical protein